MFFAKIHKLLILLLLYSCVSVNMTPDQELARDYARNIALENWQVCELEYRTQGKPTYHRHHHDGHRASSANEVNQDLSDNDCRLILRDGWIE